MHRLHEYIFGFSIRLVVMAVACLWPFHVLAGQETGDPFAGAPVPRQEQEQEVRALTSRDFLSDELLTAFDAPRLENGVGKGKAVIRITVLRTFHAPIMFTWYPGERGSQSDLHVKRLRRVVVEQGQSRPRKPTAPYTVVKYLGLDLNNRLRLRPGQRANLYAVLETVDVHSLPSKCWQERGLDGSQWIYEFAAGNGCQFLHRNNPISVNYYLKVCESLGLPKISRQRLVREMQLTTFAMMMWTLAGVEGETPY